MENTNVQRHECIDLGCARTRKIISAILDERLRQDTQWGGPTHDDQHCYTDWLTFIRSQLGSVLAIPGSRKELDAAIAIPENREAFVRRMVNVAALAIAAIESVERKAGK